MTMSRLAGLVMCLVWVATSAAVELVTLHPENYDAFVPAGEETEAIFGDYVLRNDKIIAVIADPALIRGRSASRKNPPFSLGSIIDLTRRDAPNDRLLAFDPGYAEANKRALIVVDGVPDEPQRQILAIDSAEAYKQKGREPQSAKSLSLAFPCQAPGVEIRYTLADGWDYVQTEIVYQTAGLKKLSKPFRPTALLWLPSALWGSDSTGHLSWGYDINGGQAYGMTSEDFAARPVPGEESFIRADVAKGETFPLPTTPTYTVTRRLYPARDLFHLRALVNADRGVAQQPFRIVATAPDGPVADATVTASINGISYAIGRTDAAGALAGLLPPGEYIVKVSAYGRAAVETSLSPGPSGGQTLTLEAGARLRLTVRDAARAGIPCKAELRGIGETKDPTLDGRVDRVRNLMYSADGRFVQILPPGRYRLLVSHGPEYDYADQEFTIADGKDTEVTVTLTRTMDTTGWISTEFGNRSTQSRTFSTLPVDSRVLNLAAEQIEFAPACERDVVFTYEDRIAALGLQAHLASCPGIGLTERVRKTVTSQNAFPVIYRRGAQDGGAVQRPQHVYQVYWLNSWYGPLTATGNAGYFPGNEKLIQVTPPDIHENDGKWHGMWSLFREPGGAEGISRNNRINEVRLYDSMEVQPLEGFLELPAFDPADPAGTADIAVWRDEMDGWARTKDWPKLKNANLYWLRMLNLGHRITGVANGNAYDAYHGSGIYRNYVKIDEDSPLKIDPLAVVRAVKAGRVVMSTGPFMTVTASAGDHTVGIGDDLIAPGGQAVLHVRIQAQRGTVIDRVRVLYNGRPVPALTRTRAKQPELFQDGTVQFAADIPLQVAVDTRVMVLADGLGPNLWDRKRADPATLGQRRQVVMSNPIYLDIAGDGFRPYSPWQDRVYTHMDWDTPLLSAAGAAPADIVLDLVNLGTEPATDTFSVQVLQPGLAEIVGDNAFSYTLAPGERRQIRFQVRPKAGAALAGKTVLLRIPRSSASTGRRPVGLRMVVDQTAKPAPPRDPLEQGWLPEQDRERPPDLMWPEYRPVTL